MGCLSFGVDVGLFECRPTRCWCFVGRWSKTPTCFCLGREICRSVVEDPDMGHLPKLVNVGLFEYRPTVQVNVGLFERRPTRCWCFVGRWSKTPTCFCLRREIGRSVVDDPDMGHLPKLVNVGLFEYRPTKSVGLFECRPTGSVGLFECRPTLWHQLRKVFKPAAPKPNWYNSWVQSLAP